MPTYPQTRPVHSITEAAPGTKGTLDPAESSAPTQKLITALPFGVLVVQGVGGFDIVAVGSTAAVGALPVSTLAGDYKNNAHLALDAVAPIRRGYLYVKIDPAAKPLVGTGARVSYAVGKEGWLTNSVVTSKIVSGIRVENVYDTVAEVYFDGSAEYTLT